MEKKIVIHEGKKYEMGMSFSVIKQGDLIETKSGLEEILYVVTIRNWEGVSVKTRSGAYNSFMPNEIFDYGKKIED